MSGTENLFGKIAGEVLLGKIRFDPRQGEPPYLQPLRNILLQLKKTLGDGDFDRLADDLRPAMHAFADALFDRLTETRTEKTLAALRDLPIQHRLMVENMVNALTGGLDPRENKKGGWWNDELWEVKKRIRYMTDISISGITLSDVRIGFDSFVHSVVDWICDNRKVLVS